MARTRSILRAGLGVALGCWMGVSSTVVTLAADSVADEASRATAYAIQLQRSLQAIEDGRQQAPRDRWDPQYIVDTVGVDPAALYGWERQNVGWVPYRGQLRGPVGVLMDRRANSLDMSLLLARLMSLAGLKARLAHATLSDDVVDGLWNDLAATAAQAAAAPPSDGDTAMLIAPSAPKLAPLTAPTDQPAVLMRAAASDTPSGSLFAGAGEESGSLFGAPEAEDTAPQSPQDVANLYDLDPAKGTDTLTAASDMRDDLADELQRRVADQGVRMLSLVGPAGDKQAAQEQARDRAALADHWWVQVENNGNWTDYDLLAPAATVGSALAAPEQTLEPNAIPQDARQRVEIKVVAEQLVGGKLKQNTLLAQDVDPSASIGQRITLRNMPLLWPADWDAITPDDVQEKLFAALYTQSEWMPMLSIGDEAYQQQSVRDTGEPNADPQPQSNPFLSLAFPAAGKVGRITDLFGQMLDESAGLDGGDTPEPTDMLPENEPRPQGELTAEWLDFTTYVPGEAPRVERRALFDILGDSMRRSGDFSTFQIDQDARLKRAAGEMTTTEILVLPCWPASEYIADMTAGLALANKPVLDEFAKDPFGKAPPNSIELFSKMKGMAAPAYLYSVLRSQALQTNSSVFVDRPQIVAQHDILARVGPGELTSQAALDVVENGVGVDPFSGRDSFMVRVLQGIADTNAEALALPQGGDSVANAFAVPDGNWTALLPADRDRVAALGLPPDIATRLSADLDAGYAAVLPTDLQDAGKHGWWRIDPASGATLGIGNLGWGQDLVEFAFQLMIQAMMAQIACMAYTAATAGVEAGIEKVKSGKNITGGDAEEGRQKIAEWSKNCVSQALVELTAGLSVSWIHSHFIDGAKVPTWNDRAKASSTPHGSTTVPNGGPANGPHTAPPTEEGGNNGPRTTPPTEEGGNNGPRTTPPTEEGGNNGPRTTPPTEEGGNNGPRTTPPTEEGGNNGPRTTPPTEEGGNSNSPRTTPPTEETDQLKPLPPDDSLDGKTRLDPNCVAEAYEMRVAMLEVDPSPTRSDAQPAPLVAANCPPSGGKQPPAETEGPPAPQDNEATSPRTPPADLATAKGQYDEALDAYRKDPTPANADALKGALHDLDKAEAANPRPQPTPPAEPSPEYTAAKQTYDEALRAFQADPSPANRAALGEALADYNRAAFPPREAPTGPAHPEGSPTPAAPPGAEPEGPPTPRPQQPAEPAGNLPQTAEQEGPPTPRPQDPALADTQAPRTEPMEGAPARPTAEREGPPTPRPEDPALADTQAPHTQPMEGAPARPTAEGEPQGAPRPNGGNDDALADTQAVPRPGTHPDTIKQLGDAERAAAARADDAFTKWEKNPTPENNAALHQADAEHSAAIRAAGDAWGQATPEQRAEALGQYTAERQAAQQAFNEAIRARDANPTADTRQAALDAYNAVNAARNAEMSAAGSAHLPLPDGTPPPMAPLPPVEPMAQPEGPPTPRPQDPALADTQAPRTEPMEGAPARPIAEREGPPTPRPEDPALADTQAPRTEPMEGAPARPTAEREGPPTPRPEDPALADTQAPRTEPMEGAPARPTAEREGPPTPRPEDPALADTQAVPRPGTQPDTIKQLGDAERAAAARADDAFTKWNKNPTPENNAAMHQADAEHSAAIRAAGEAWGQATPEQRAEALGQYTAERQAAQEAFNEAIRARDANRTADTIQAAIDAQDAVNAARNAEMSAAGSAHLPLPDGTPPPMAPLPPVEPMAQPEGPPTPRPQEPAEPAANPRPTAEQEGPPTPRAPDEPPVSPRPAGEPEGPPTPPNGDNRALADTQLAETQNEDAPQTQRMPDAPPRPTGEPDATPQVRTGSDDPLAQTQLNQTQPMEGAPQRPTAQNIVDAANAHTDAAEEFYAVKGELSVNPTAEEQARYDAALDKYFAAQKAEQQAWKNATQEERVRAQDNFAAQREEAEQRLYDTKLQYDINPSEDNKAAWNQAKIDAVRARRSEAQAATETGLPIAPSPNAPPGYKPIEQSPTPAATPEPEGPPTPRPAESEGPPTPRAAELEGPPTPRPTEPEGPPTPRPAEPASSQPSASPNAKSIALDNPRPVQQSAEPQPIAPLNQTQPMEGAPQRPTAKGIYDAVKNADASDAAYLEAGAAARAEGSPEALARAEQAGLANADAINAERNAWQQASPEERLAAQKMFADDRAAAQRRLDAARAANNANSTEESQAALQQAARDYAKAREAEVRASGSAGVDADFLPSAVAGEPSPPSNGPPPAEGASPNAQSVVIDRPQPVQANAEPQDVAPLQQAAPNQTQPMQNAPARPPQTYEERVLAIQSFTDAAIEANNAKAAAAQALMANDTYQTRLDYDRAAYAEEQARRTEAGRWYRVGGVGALPSQVSGRLQPMPEGLQEQIEANHPALAKTASADVTGGTNTTLAMGLGSLAGTIQRGP